MIPNILNLMLEFHFQILPAIPKKEKGRGNEVEKNFILTWFDRKILDVDQNVSWIFKLCRYWGNSQMPDFNGMWISVICLQYKHCKYCEEHFSCAWKMCEISHCFWLWSLTTEQCGTGGLSFPSLCSAPLLLLSKFLQLHSYFLLGNCNLFPFLKYLKGCNFILLLVSVPILSRVEKSFVSLCYRGCRLIDLCSWWWFS